MKWFSFRLGIIFIQKWASRFEGLIRPGFGVINQNKIVLAHGEIFLVQGWFSRIFKEKMKMKHLGPLHIENQYCLGLGTGDTHRFWLEQAHKGHLFHCQMMWYKQWGWELKKEESISKESCPKNFGAYKIDIDTSRGLVSPHK